MVKQITEGKIGHRTIVRPEARKRPNPEPPPVIAPRASVSELREQASEQLARQIAKANLSAMTEQQKIDYISRVSRAFWMQFDLRYGIDA